MFRQKMMFLFVYLPPNLKENNFINAHVSRTKHKSELSHLHSQFVFDQAVG